jgi:hypothetical protein
MLDPPGGLELGPEGGGADFEWFCRDGVACALRIAANIREFGSESEEARYEDRHRGAP